MFRGDRDLKINREKEQKKGKEEQRKALTERGNEVDQEKQLQETAIENFRRGTTLCYKYAI